MEAEEKGRKKIMEKHIEMEEKNVVYVGGARLECRKSVESRNFVRDACTGWRVSREECVRVDNVAGQPYVYVLSRWAGQMPYGSDWVGNDPVIGKISEKSIRYSPEFECDDPESLAPDEVRRRRLYLAAQFRLEDTADCTVDHEFKAPNRVNLSGFKDMLEGVQRLFDMSSERCGLHINASYPLGWKVGNEVVRIGDRSHRLLDPVAMYLEEHPDDMVKVFGRPFGHWARNDSNYQHGSWINLEHDRGDEARIEYRLPHYHGVNETTWTVKMLCEWTEILTEWLQGRLPEAEVSKRLIKNFRRYADGKAPCQKAKRNTLDRV
jgi:hypothetical protein